MQDTVRVILKDIKDTYPSWIGYRKVHGRLMKELKPKGSGRLCCMSIHWETHLKPACRAFMDSILHMSFGIWKPISLKNAKDKRRKIDLSLKKRRRWVFR